MGELGKRNIRFMLKRAGVPVTLTYLGADYKTHAEKNEVDSEQVQGDTQSLIARLLSLRFETDSVPGLVPGVLLEVGEVPTVEVLKVVQVQRENDGLETIAFCMRQ